MRIKILIVDDYKPITRFLEGEFSKFFKGCRVLTAPTSREGLSLIVEEEPHVVLYEWMIGGGSEMQLMESFYRFRKKQPNCPHPQFVILTTSPYGLMDYIEERGYQVYSVVHKPFTTSSEIKEIVSRAILNDVQEKELYLSILLQQLQEEEKKFALKSAWVDYLMKRNQKELEERKRKRAEKGSDLKGN